MLLSQDVTITGAEAPTATATPLLAASPTAAPAAGTIAPTVIAPPAGGAGSTSGTSWPWWLLAAAVGGTAAAAAGVLLAYRRRKQGRSTARGTSSEAKAAHTARYIGARGLTDPLLANAIAWLVMAMRWLWEAVHVLIDNPVTCFSGRLSTTTGRGHSGVARNRRRAAPAVPDAEQVRLGRSPFEGRGQDSRDVCEKFPVANW